MIECYLVEHKFYCFKLYTLDDKLIKVFEDNMGHNYDDLLKFIKENNYKILYKYGN